MNHFALNAMTSGANWNTHTFRMLFHVEHITQPLTSAEVKVEERVLVYVCVCVCAKATPLVCARWLLLGFFIFSFRMKMPFGLCSQLVSWDLIQFVVNLFSVLWPVYLAIHKCIFRFLGTDFISIMIVCLSLCVYTWLACVNKPLE